MMVSIPAWLDTPPDEALATPPVSTRVQDLPFNELTWLNFERLILRLVRKQENIIDCVLYGTTGQAQEGLDILAASANTEKVACYQCKNVISFGVSDIRKTVEKFLAGKWADQSSIFVLCVAIPLNRKQQQDEITKQRNKLNKHSITFTIWDGSSGGILTEQLKDSPELVDEFFGRHWVEQFNGKEAADNLGERLDGNELGNLRKRLHGLYATVFNQHDPGLRFRGRNPLSHIKRYVPIDIVEQTTLGVAEQDEAKASEAVSQRLSTSASDALQPEPKRPSSRPNIHESRRSAFEWLSGIQHSVVLGEPGSGKSALLRYLTLSLLDSDSSDIRLLGPGHLRRLPVWMSFARYAATIKDKPNTSVDDYFRHWLHQHSFDDIYPIFKRALRHSDVLLLVDGLDEGTSEPHRQEALDRIITFVESSRATVICTSRPRGFNRSGIPDAWNTAVIAPMRDAQVQDLAARWFSVTEISNGAHGNSDVIRQQAEHRADMFLHVVNENSRTNELARNPLLCQAMIELYRYSHQLPEGRVGIYDKIIELLLSQHPAARAHASSSETPAELLGLRDAELREILLRIAEELQNKNSMDLHSVDNCRAICAGFLEDDTYGLGLNRSKAKRLAEDTIEQLVSQYGLLVERSPGDIGFVHLSIQEYLATEIVTRKPEEYQLIWLESIWLEPKWRECVTNWFGIQGARGKKELTGQAAQRLNQLGDTGEWQRQQSLELRTELACTDLGIPVNESREIVQQAARSVETSPFPDHRISLARSITLGAIGSSVREECAESLRRWVPGRPSFSRAELLQSFQFWQAADDLRETLMRGLHDDNFQCRSGALDSLITVFKSWPELGDTLHQLSLHHPRPEVRAVALRGLNKCPEWTEFATAASTANLESNSAELLLTACATRIQMGCHDDDDLRRMWRIWSTEAIDFWQQQEFTDLLCAGWPSHKGWRRTFMTVLQQDNLPVRRRIPLQYLLCCYPNDDEIAALVARLFNLLGVNINSDMTPIWRALIANFRGHHTVAAAVRRALDAHKDEYEAIHWQPHTIPGLVVIGDDAARDELLHAYLPRIDGMMSRYWIAKTLMDGWADDKFVQSSLRKWASQDADTAAPLAEWSTMLYPESSDRRKWLLQLVGEASSRIALDAIEALLDEFPDEKSRKLVETRMYDTKSWHYHRIVIQGWLAREFPKCTSSLETVKRTLEDIDGLQLSDFAATYENHASFRSEILGAAVAAPEDIRMTVSATLRDRAINVQTIEHLTPYVFAEESGSVRLAAMVARARASKGNEAAMQTLSDALVKELSSVGPYYRSRRGTALAALIELGHAERAVSMMAEQKDTEWNHYLLDFLHRDASSLGVVIDNWHTFKPLLAAAGLESELPIGDIIEYGYGAVLDQATMPRNALDQYLQTTLPQQVTAHHFNEIARRFPRSIFLRDRLLAAFDGLPDNHQFGLLRDHRLQYEAARLLLEHFKSNSDVLAALTTRLVSSNGCLRVTQPGVLAIFNLGWPSDTFENYLRSTSKAQRENWQLHDRLLVAVSLGDASAAEEAADLLLAEPLEDWRYRTADVEALRIWSRQAMSTPVLQKWLNSKNGTLSITTLSLVNGEQLIRMINVDQLIARFDEQMMANATTPTDGLDAISGIVTSWVIHAMTMIQDTAKS